MRNFLLVLTTIIFVVFVLVILPSAIGHKDSLASFDEDGYVLGVKEEVEDEYLERFFSGYNSLPKSKNIEKAVPKILLPYKKEDSPSVSIGESIGILVDKKTQKVLFEKEAQKPVPIASITKLMTALVLMDEEIDWREYVQIKRENLIGGAQIYIRFGEDIKRDDLLSLSLVASANSATKALVSSTGLSEREFVEKMNKKAIDLGLKNTSFFDPIGFSALNVSTAYELSILLKQVLKNDRIKQITNNKVFSFKTKQGREVIVNSTNKLLAVYPKNEVMFLTGKTGYTALAGYCFVGAFEDKKGNILISVFLQGPSYDSRFFNTDKLINWGYNNFEWQ